MFAQSSYAKRKDRKLNLTLAEKFNIIAGHSPSMLHCEVVSKRRVTFSSELFLNNLIFALVPS